MTADRRRRKSRPQTDWPEEGGEAPEERELDVFDHEGLDRELSRAAARPELNGLGEEDDFDEEDLVEVRIAVGPDGLAEAVTFPVTRG